MKREFPDHPVVAVGAAVCRQGQVLIVQRGKAPSRGAWVVPGGVVELGEKMADAVRREVREECGLEIEVGDVVGILDNIVRDEQGRIRFHYAIVDLAARYTSGELQTSDELLAAQWVTPQQLDEYGVSDKIREVVLKALQWMTLHPASQETRPG